MGKKITKTIGTFFIVIIFINLLDCSSRFEKDDKLIVEQFSEIYTRLLIAGSDSTISDSNYLDIILDSLRVSKSDYESNLLFLQKNPDLWLEVLTKVNKNLEGSTRDNPSKTSPAGSISPE